MSEPAYYQLKAAQALFTKSCAELDERESARVRKVALRYAAIESAVLGSGEARGVCLPDGAVDAALAEIRGRYEDEESFHSALSDAGLDPQRLSAALQRDLLVDLVLERVGARAEPIGTTETEIFYYTHLDRFRRPERRTARHILVTINDDLPDNTREKAERRIGEIARRLRDKPHRFEEQALKHSECPTALSGGLLGAVPRGQLYPALDQALFALPEGGISEVLESELGFHVLRCDLVDAERTLAFDEVRDALRTRLTEERARRETHQWLERLLERTEHSA